MTSVCTCRPDVRLCQECHDAAVSVATAASTTCNAGKARGVNEVEYADAQSGRVFTLRRGSDEAWHIIEVRRMGSIERSRCRPQPSNS